MSHAAAALMLELWQLVVDLIHARHNQPTDLTWRHDLFALRATCKLAYIAVYPVIWSDLHLVFYARDPRTGRSVWEANAAKMDEVASDKRPAMMEASRRRKEVVESSVCPRIRPSVGEWVSWSQVPSLLSFVVYGDVLYLPAALDKGKRVEELVSSVRSLWEPFWPEWKNDLVKVHNDTLLIPYPLHLTRHLTIDDLDEVWSNGSCSDADDNNNDPSAFHSRLAFLLDPTTSRSPLESLRIHCAFSHAESLAHVLTLRYPSIHSVDVFLLGLVHPVLPPRVAPNVRHLRVCSDCASQEDVEWRPDLADELESLLVTAHVMECDVRELLTGLSARKLERLTLDVSCHGWLGVELSGQTVRLDAPGLRRAAVSRPIARVLWPRPVSVDDGGVKARDRFLKLEEVVVLVPRGELELDEVWQEVEWIERQVPRRTVVSIEESVCQSAVVGDVDLSDPDWHS